MAHDVFISYASENKAQADAACAKLEEHRIRCWIAPRDIVAGRPYGEAIIEAISNARLLVLLFSREADQSEQVVREVERAVSKGLPIIPLRIEDVRPTRSMEYFLSAPHWLDALTPPLEAHLDKLVANVGTLLETRPPASAASPPPIVEQAGKQRAAFRWGNWMLAGLAVITIGLLIATQFWKQLGRQQLVDHGQVDNAFENDEAEQEPRPDESGDAADRDEESDGQVLPNENQNVDSPSAGPEPPSSDGESTDENPSAPTDPPPAQDEPPPTRVPVKESPDQAADVVKQPAIDIYITEQDGTGAAILERPNFKKHVADTLNHRRLANGTPVELLEQLEEDLGFGKMPWARVRALYGKYKGTVGWILFRDLRLANPAEVDRYAEAALQLGAEPTTAKLSVEPMEWIREMQQLRDRWPQAPLQTATDLEQKRLEVEQAVPLLSEAARQQLFKQLDEVARDLSVTGTWRNDRGLEFRLTQNAQGEVSGFYFRRGDAAKAKVDGFFDANKLKLRFLSPGGNGDMEWTFHDVSTGTVRWRSDGNSNTGDTYRVSRIRDSHSG